MTVVWIILAWLLMLTGLLGTLLPVLPGTLLIWTGALLYAWATNFQQVDGWLLLLLAILAGATVLAGYVSSAIGARTLGASRRGVAGAMIGGLLGFVVLGPVGVLAGPFAGAILGELTAGRKIQEAARVGVGSAIGVLGSILFDFLVGLAMIGVVLLRVL